MNGFLSGLRVLELADELGEYCGKVLAGLGADVLKVETPEGEVTRTYGPFYHDVVDPDRSLHFWHYNLGKRSIVLDLDTDEAAGQFRALAATADVILDTRHRTYMKSRGLSYEELKQANPQLVYARISPFGDTGPWADWNGSDIVHLALGGVMMNCGYDPEPSGRYDTPPVAPPRWQSYHIAGEMTAIAIVAALNYRLSSGLGQLLSTAVHDAVAKNTETDLPSWVYLRQSHHRKTCRHAMNEPAKFSLAMTKDGRWTLPYSTYLSGGNTFGKTLDLLKKYGMQFDLENESYRDPEVARRPATTMHVAAAVKTLVGAFKFDKDLWREAQGLGLPWAPIRRPEENIDDEHWACRDTFFGVEHPELGESFIYTGAKWLSPEVPWRHGPRAPLLGEHTDQILAELDAARARGTTQQGGSADHNDMSPEPISRRGKPFALAGVRVLDLSWILGSGGAGRFFTSLGAEVIKIEHESRMDPVRWGHGMTPDGGRHARDLAVDAIPTPRDVTSPNRSGHFMEINAGKRSLSLNLKDERGKEILAKLVALSDIIIEGFSPGTMERMGFGYDRLKEINPKIVYVQQSGMGQIGSYGAFRSYGPTAAALSGLSDMSGLPEPYPPAGIGYSYLDWFGAYNMALGMMAGLYRANVTGQGCYIDASQVETGMYLNGSAVLDYTVNGRRWARYGNRSPYKLAAPHGAYRTKGEDRWIAIACFTDEQWHRLASVLRPEDLPADVRFLTLSERLARHEDLDEILADTVKDWDPFELMTRLQDSGVPAGVCQTAEDRYEWDPQLKHLEWLVELNQTEMGTWPVKEIPVKYSHTPPYIGGRLDRSGPNYGEDNEYVLSSLLGLSACEIELLREDRVI
jgi:crotonobetainyl-CoA:carnitine CoA-transferase CaiB-like acyl-CoA transferase